MKLIVCLDEDGGMAFNRRRQTRDRVQKEHLFRKIGDEVLWMSPYSAKQFAGEREEGLSRISEDYLTLAGEEDYVLAERDAVNEVLEQVTELLIYRWNRSYPSDVVFPVEMLADRTLVESEEFRGSSHDCITFERYV